MTSLLLGRVHPFGDAGLYAAKGRARIDHGTLFRTARRARDLGSEVRRLSLHADPARISMAGLRRYRG